MFMYHFYLLVYLWAFRLGPCLGYCKPYNNKHRYAMIHDRLTESFEYNHRIGIMDHTIIIFLYFWGGSILISIVPGPVYISTWECKSYSHSYQICYLVLFCFVCLVLVLPSCLMFYLCFSWKIWCSCFCFRENFIDSIYQSKYIAGKDFLP